MAIHLSGNQAPHRSKRSVTTPGAALHFSTDLGVDGYRAVPGLVITTRDIQDPSPRVIAPSDETLQAIGDLASLTDALTKLLTTHQDHLNATDIDAGNTRLGVAGQRKEALFKRLVRALPKTSIPPQDHPAARRLLRSLEEETYQGRDIDFETAKFETYHPYDQPFDGGVRKMAALAPKGIARDAITQELNYITDRKTQLDSDYLREWDAEQTLLLRPIDRDNDNQALSLAANSVPGRPQYVLLNVASADLPEAHRQYAGKAVLRDGERLLFDGTATPLPPELSAHLVERPASDNTGLRRLQEGETPRVDFPYDWDRNKRINVDPIVTDWWGHCHIEAPLTALSVNAASEVTVFDARSKEMTTFEDSDINDLLFAMLDADHYEDMRTSKPASVKETTFVGFRNGTTYAPKPADKLILQVKGKERSFKLTIDELFGPNGPVDPATAFSPTVVSEGIAFKQNPAFKGLRDNDWSTVDGNQKLTGTIQYVDLNPDGTLERKTRSITLDPQNPSDEPVLVGTRRRRGGHPPKITRYFLNEKSGNLESRIFAPTQQADGTWTMVPTSSKPRIIGAVTGRTLSRELTHESLVEFHEHVLEAARRGVSFVTEESGGYMVWNYGTTGLRLDKVQKQGDFTQYEISLRLQGASDSTWKYTLRHDEEGRPVEAHAGPLTFPADFLWRPKQLISAPIVRNSKGRILTNSDAAKRGFLLDASGQISDAGFSFFRYASDLIYASLEDRSKDERYVIIDPEGELYFYEDTDSYKADALRLGAKLDTVNATLAPKEAPKTTGAPLTPVTP
ncbi:MAG: hypothetical protein VX699_01100 [Myxococcota bacterium]|nr:hypothetical protein [Myxococcota bacterium]